MTEDVVYAVDTDIQREIARDSVCQAEFAEYLIQPTSHAHYVALLELI